MDCFDPERCSDGSALLGRSEVARAAGPSTSEGSAHSEAARDTEQPEAPDPTPPGGSLPAEWFHRYFDLLWRLVARLGIVGHYIDDVVQETFITASRKRADIHAGQERRFLISAAIRLSSNFRQRAHVRREVGDSDRLELEASAVPDPERLLIEKRLRIQLDAALSTLSDAHREVFVLYELEGFSTSEIADLLGIPHGTVASRLARARAGFSKAAARSFPPEHK